MCQPHSPGVWVRRLFTSPCAHGRHGGAGAREGGREKRSIVVFTLRTRRASSFVPPPRSPFLRPDVAHHRGRAAAQGGVSHRPHRGGRGACVLGGASARFLARVFGAASRGRRRGVAGGAPTRSRLHSHRPLFAEAGAAQAWAGVGGASVAALKRRPAQKKTAAAIQFATLPTSPPTPLLRPCPPPPPPPPPPPTPAGAAPSWRAARLSAWPPRSRPRSLKTRPTTASNPPASPGHTKACSRRTTMPPFGGDTRCTPR